MLPGLDGLEVFRRLRGRHPVPVVMLTARGDEVKRVAGLELGADDYLAKPFSPRELVLRVAAVLRRVAPAPRGLLVDGDLVVDLVAREPRRGGQPLALTVREFDLLTFLLQHPRGAFSRSALLLSVRSWSVGDASAVTVHVRRLREKVEDDASPRGGLSPCSGSVIARSLRRTRHDPAGRPPRRARHRRWRGARGPAGRRARAGRGPRPVHRRRPRGPCAQASSGQERRPPARPPWQCSCRPTTCAFSWSSSSQRS